MIKITKQQFQFFEKECRRWIDIFELNNWEVEIIHKKLEDGSYAKTITNLNGYVATTFLTKEWDDEDLPCTKEEIAKTALHEVLHLLIARTRALSNSRYVSKDEIIGAEEELVNKLIHFIKNEKNPIKKTK